MSDSLGLKAMNREVMTARDEPVGSLRIQDERRLDVGT